jgi:hypothetical protein
MLMSGIAFKLDTTTCTDLVGKDSEIELYNQLWSEKRINRDLLNAYQSRAGINTAPYYV